MAALNISRIRMNATMESRGTRSKRTQNLTAMKFPPKSERRVNAAQLIWQASLPDSMKIGDILPSIKVKEATLRKLQDKWLAKEHNPLVISLHEPDNTEEGRYRVVRVNGRRIRTRGPNPKRLQQVAFMDPMKMVKKWKFLLPTNEKPERVLDSSGNEIPTGLPVVYRVRRKELEFGFSVKSVEKAVCILKLIFFKLDKKLKDRRFRRSSESPGNHRSRNH